MADLIAIAFDGRERAEEALAKLSRMQKQHLVDLEDAVVVTKDETGKVHLIPARP